VAAASLRIGIEIAQARAYYVIVDPGVRIMRRAVAA